MKSYEEMTDSVLNRAKRERAILMKKRKNRLLTVLCVCIAAAAIFAGIRNDRQTAEREPRVSVFCITANAAGQAQEMIKDTALPYNAVIRIQNVAGMGMHELQALEAANREYAENMAAESGNDLPGSPQWSMTTGVFGKLLITSIYAGCYYMVIDDYELVEDVVVSTTEIGLAAADGTDFRSEETKDCIGVTWTLSEKGVDLLTKNPEMELSELKDTIIVTVLFKDGISETVVIDVTLDDDGQIYGTFREIKIA